MSNGIGQRLEHLLQQRSLQSTSLLISLVGDAVLPRGGAIWLGSLIRLVEPFGMNERLVRTAVFRLVKEGWLRTESCGRRANYLLTEVGRRRFQDASRQIYASNAPLWDRRWRMVLVVGDLAPKEREQIRRALSWQGFGMLGASCFVHPGVDLPAALDALAAEGLGEPLRHLMPMIAVDVRSGLAADDTDLVERAWNLEALAAEYEAFVATYQPLLSGLGAEPRDEAADERAFLLRVLLIHDYRRLLLRDPELPDVLLPADWPGQRARLLCKDIYRRLLAPSERHLDRHMRLANGALPAAGMMLAQRFPDDDPLGAGSAGGPVPAPAVMV